MRVPFKRNILLLFFVLGLKASLLIAQNKIPQIQWNQVKCDSSSVLLKGLTTEDYYYFLHSFYIIPEETKSLVGKTQYCGVNYCSLVESENIMGVHSIMGSPGPSESGSSRLQFLHWVTHLGRMSPNSAASHQKLFVSINIFISFCQHLC